MKKKYLLLICIFSLLISCGYVEKTEIHINEKAYVLISEIRGIGGSERLTLQEKNFLFNKIIFTIHDGSLDPIFFRTNNDTIEFSFNNYFVVDTIKIMGNYPLKFSNYRDLESLENLKTTNSYTGSEANVNVLKDKRKILQDNKI